MTTALVLVPTNYELQQLHPLLANSVERAGGKLMTCGFGVISSGIRTSQLLAQHSPKAVLLVGIAGAMGPQLQVGTAACFSRIACYGIGAGSGSDFESATELGWPQWDEFEHSEALGDIIEIDDDSCPGNSMLLTTCAASANEEDVANKLSKFPDASAEDMEAYSVAMACRTAKIPLTVIRGISNIAGDRNKNNWNVFAAINAAAELTNLRISQ